MTSNPLVYDTMAAGDSPSSINAESPVPLLARGRGNVAAAAVEEEWQSVPRTFFVACVAVLNQVTFGYDVGAVSQCLRPISHEFSLSPLELGAVTSALNFFAAGGALLVSGFLLDRYGRRVSLVAAAVLLIAGGTAVAAAASYAALVFGRFLQGLGVGCSWAASGIYVTEIAPPARRGALVALVDVAINLGIVAGYCCAYAIEAYEVGSRARVAPWRVAMGASVVPPLLFLLAAPWMPESPRFLAARGRDDDALEALRRLKKPTASPAPILRARDALAAAARADAGEDSTWARAAVEGRYAGLLAIAQQATGTEAILYFSPTVLPGGSKLVAFVGNAGVGAAKFFGEVLAAAVGDSPRLGRRSMTVRGSAGVCGGLFAFAFLVKRRDPPPAALIAALSFVMLAFSLGPGPFTTVFLNEVVPTRHRAKSSALATFYNRITSACVALSFLPLSAALGAAPVFAAYGAVAAAATVLYARTLPETVGVSLENLHGGVY